MNPSYRRLRVPFLPPYLLLLFLRLVARRDKMLVFLLVFYVYLQPIYNASFGPISKSLLIYYCYFLKYMFCSILFQRYGIFMKVIPNFSKILISTSIMGVCFTLKLIQFALLLFWVIFSLHYCMAYNFFKKISTLHYCIAWKS